jgi:hypothetical protein
MSSTAKVQTMTLIEVVTPDGERHPRFAPATPEQAKENADV